MNKTLLKTLTEKRIAHFKSLKKNRDRSHSIIGEQLYSKQSHFIFELLQNAEDEAANKVKIAFDNEKLIFEHNGRTFDIEDIEAITSFGDNERKKLKPNAIGRFGIGFKSVFSVTEKPEIKSGDFHFTISNFIVPNLIDSEKIKGTIITLPFKKSKQSQIVSKIETTLSDLDSTYLLFLNNIKLIEIVNLQNGESRFIRLKKISYKESLIKIFNISEGENQNEFLLFEGVVSIIKKKLSVKIAFSINRKANKIEFERIDSSPLFAFFATEKETNLPFYIHAPFLTTPARDNIISDDLRNQKLFSGLNLLMINAIDLLKENNLIDLNTWLVLPCDMSFYKNEIYKMFCDSFFQYLTNKKTLILPSDDDGFCQVYSAMRFENKEFKSLISIKEAHNIFGRTEWITRKINKADYRIVNTWVEQQFKVPTVGFKELCQKVDDSFFKHKSDDWLLKFYQSISDNPELWRSSNRNISEGPLRNKAFIRTSKNKTVNPFDENGNLNVYLPTSGTSDYQYVKSVFLADNESRKLFKSLNITTPDLISEVNEHIIPRIIKASNPYRGLKEDIQKILKAIRKADSEEEENIINKLKQIAWLPGKNNLTKKISLNKPDEIYFPTRDLFTLLSKSSTAIFLDQTIFSDNKSKQNSRSIFEDVNVYFRPRRFYRQNDDIIFEKKSSESHVYWNGDEVELEGLKEYLRITLDKKASINLWNIFIRSIDHWGKIGYDRTNFTKQLKETKWLFNKFGQRLRPDEITPSELDEAYEESGSLMDALEFKVDEIKNFEIEHGGKFLSNDELQKMKDEFDELKRENERLKKQYEPTDEPDIDNFLPDINDIEIGNPLSSEESSITDDGIPDNYQTDSYNDDAGNGSVGVLTNTFPTKRQKTIGLRGEEFVLKLLREKHQSDNSILIKDLNEDDKLGVGCDIIVLKDGLAKILIEVKSTEGGYENRFKISEKQWRTAIKSHLNSDEPEYYIYCVYYASALTPQYIIIKDPIDWMLKRHLRFVEQWFNVPNIKNKT